MRQFGQVAEGWWDGALQRVVVDDEHLQLRELPEPRGDVSLEGVASQDQTPESARGAKGVRYAALERVVVQHQVAEPRARRTRPPGDGRRYGAC